jgi:hypothetical protein
MRLSDIIIKQWMATMPCGVLHRIAKLSNGWKITTACMATASIMECALSLPKSNKYTDAVQLAIVLKTFSHHVHTKQTKTNFLTIFLEFVLFQCVLLCFIFHIDFILK